MAKKRLPKKTAKKASKKDDVQIVLSPNQDNALKLVDKSAKVRGELEEAVKLAAAKVVRKCMKEHGIGLTAPEASLLTSIWFEED